MCFKQHRVRYQRSRKAPGIKPLDILNDEQQKEKHAASQFFSSLLETTVQELDEIATHYRVEGCNIDNLKLVEMNASTIKFELRGSVDCQLQYGSDGDYARGDGVRVDDNYPLSCDLVAHIADPLKLSVERLRVDNSSFYE